MSDLISRQALLAEYDRQHVGEAGRARKLIEDAPKVDAEPVRHGRWKPAEIIGYDGYHAVYAYPCNRCGKYTREHKPYYCPNCGAKMDAEDIKVPTNEPGKICPINGAPCNECVPGAHCAKMDGGGE